MSPKSRHHNRASRSFLPNDLLRSITRGRSYHTVETSASSSDLRSQSSLSCDPNAQSQPTINRMNGLRHGFSALSNNSIPASCHDDDDSGSQARDPCATSDDISRHRKRRRMSWLSKPWSILVKDGKPYSMTTLPPATSMSSISKSSISSPVLTSTTNPRVANRENLQCSEVLFPISSPQEHHSRGDDVLGADDSSTIHAVDNNSTWTSSVRNIRAKLGHSRRASTGVLLTSSWSRRRHPRWDHAGPASISSHRKAGTAIKEKIQQLGERLHVLSVGSGNSVVGNAEIVKAKGIQPHQPDDSRTLTPRATPSLPGLRSDSTTNLLRGSLNRSFASAVDKLDVNSSPTLVHHSPVMAGLRRMKTLIQMYEQYDDDVKTSNKNNTPSKDLKTDVSKLRRYEDKTRTFDSPTSAEVSEPGVTQHDDPFSLRSPPPDLQEQQQVRDSDFAGRDGHPDPRDLSASYSDEPQSPTAPYTPSVLERQKRKPNTLGPDFEPHPSPLSSHSEVMSFTEPKIDQDDPYALGEAPIYSPSTGDLSHHTRTPSPKPTKTGPATIKARVFQETPTKQPSLGGRLKKSVSGFFVKSASKMRLTSSASRQIRIQREIEQEQEQVQERDIEPASVETPIRVTKQATLDHHPVTPSSLRYESRPGVSERGEASRERASTMPSSAPLSESGSELFQPRTRTTTRNPEKRRAMYGERDFKDFRASRIEETKPYGG